MNNSASFSTDKKSQIEVTLILRTYAPEKEYPMKKSLRLVLAATLLALAAPLAIAVPVSPSPIPAEPGVIALR
jgi:hypothetical protein